jgi:hypothetical protein
MLFDWERQGLEERRKSLLTGIALLEAGIRAGILCRDAEGNAQREKKKGFLEKELALLEQILGGAVE